MTTVWIEWQPLEHNPDEVERLVGVKPIRFMTHPDGKIAIEFRGYPSFDALEMMDKLMAFQGRFRDAKSFIALPVAPKVPGSKVRYRANKFIYWLKAAGAFYLKGSG